MGLLSFSPGADADEPGPNALPVKVVSIKSDDALDQAEALTGALQKAVRGAQGWSLAEGKAQSLEFLILQMKCPEPIDAACEARIADVIKADRYLWGTVEPSGDFVTGSLNYWVRGKGTSSTELKYSANLADASDDALIEVAKEAFTAVSGGPPKGGLRVTTGGIEAQLYVDGEPIGALAAEGATYQLPAGDHEIVVKAPGYADAETSVTVQPATTVDASVTMVEVGEGSSVDGRLIGGIVSLAVGVGAGAVGLWAALEVSGIDGDEDFQRYQEGFTTEDDVCEAARAGRASTAINPPAPSDVAAQCDTADDMEIVQAVMFPVAAVAAGIGAFLLGTSSTLSGDGGGAADEAEEDEEVSVRIDPMVGPTAGRLQITVSF